MSQTMLATLGLAIVGQIVYQFGQRAVPADASPLVVLTIAYFAAGALCVALALVSGTFSANSEAMSLRPALTWPTWLIAIAIVAIEVGYLTAYRSGWTLGTAFAIAGTVTIIVLALADWVSFGNALSPRQLAGLACSCAGLWLLSTGMRAH